MTSPFTSPAPVLYLPHGGGPLPLLDDPSHRALIEFLTSIGARLGNPAAIVVISAHWEAQRPTLTCAPRPPLLYDYAGFPEACYRITYPVPGHPALAAIIRQRLAAAALETEPEHLRGFDHGVFVPLKLIYPRASIPCIQLSLVNSLDPGLHIRLGAALAGLRKENILILGSGFSFHNLREFRQGETATADTRNTAFEGWLNDTLTRTDLSETERQQRLVDWEQAPFARYCHPREEHLLPLHVCYGAAGAPGQRVFNDTVLGKRTSAYLWS